MPSSSQELTNASEGRQRERHPSPLPVCKGPNENCPPRTESHAEARMRPAGHLLASLCCGQSYVWKSLVHIHERALPGSERVNKPSASLSSEEQEEEWEEEREEERGHNSAATEERRGEERRRVFSLAICCTSWLGNRWRAGTSSQHAPGHTHSRAGQLASHGLVKLDTTQELHSQRATHTLLGQPSQSPAPAGENAKHPPPPLCVHTCVCRGLGLQSGSWNSCVGLAKENSHAPPHPTPLSLPLDKTQICRKASGHVPSM